MLKRLLILLMVVIQGYAYWYYRLPNVIERAGDKYVSVEIIRVVDDVPQKVRGSGIVLGDGFILTAKHVIHGAETATVIYNNGVKLCTTNFFEADNVDVGLIVVGTGGGELDEPVLYPRVGDTVFAIGNLFTLNNTVTVGYLSARNREVNGERLHQLDMFVGSGMSGGPVFSRFGNVVGMVVRGGKGIGFMVPIENCAFIVEVYKNLYARTK